MARRPGIGHQPQVQRARRADLLRPARGRRAARRVDRLSSTAIRTAGGRRPRSSTAAPRNGSSRWTSRSTHHARQDAAPSSAGRMKAARSIRPTQSPTRAPTLRQLALQAIAETRFVPEKGRNRIGSMVEGRPDWVLSRQRAWGVPIALFVERKTGELLVDPRGQRAHRRGDQGRGRRRLGRRAARRNISATATTPPITSGSTDILDVWFDSGCTHVFTLESGHWPEQRWPADLYLEGSDQHRGWFQSSLLESCGTRGRAPYDAVLTHGFTMDAKGMKMSKSLGNTINPLELMRDYGADIIRLWALSVDFTEDHRIGKEILAGVADQYRKLRNTLPLPARRARRVRARTSGSASSEMPELERYMLALTRRARREAAPGGRRLRLQHLRPRADRLLQRGSVGLLLRYPQGQPLLRRAERPEAPRLSHRARHPVPRAGPLGRAGAGVHQRGSVGHALSRCGQRPPARMARDRHRMAQRCAGSEVGDAARAAHRGDRGDRAAAPRQGHRLEPRSRSDRARATPIRRCLAELFIVSSVKRGDALVGDQDRATTNAAAAGGSCPKSRTTATCARAARRW